MFRAEQLNLPLPKVEAKEITWVFFVRYDPKYKKLLFLIAERKSNGRATFPGGKIEENETAVIAATRETKEETSIKLDPAYALVPMGKIVFPDGGNLYEASTFLTFYDEFIGLDLVNLEPEKHSFWQWIAIQDLLKNPKLHFVLQLILQSDVLEVAIESIFIELENFENEILPTAFMEECSNIKYAGKLKEFAANLLG